MKLKPVLLKMKRLRGEVTSVAKEGTYENGVSSFDVTIKIDKPGDIKNWDVD
ncbi:hypothetical protein RCO48_00665 [Peribacillus frigoritolerans]|nr:hypothetical protein [Peribacillus frigoritolerans]